MHTLNCIGRSVDIGLAYVGRWGALSFNFNSYYIFLCWSLTGMALLFQFQFLDALASLNSTLRVGEPVTYRFQLAHLRVFQIISFPQYVGCEVHSVSISILTTYSYVGRWLDLYCVELQFQFQFFPSCVPRSLKSTSASSMPGGPKTFGRTKELEDQ